MTQLLSRTIERVIIAVKLTVIILCICEREGGGGIFSLKRAIVVTPVVRVPVTVPVTLC